MNISLTPGLDEWVNQQVKSGLYESSSEVIREGIRLLQRHEEQRLAMIEELSREVMIGVNQLEKRLSFPFDSSMVQQIKKEGRSKSGL